ncbi:MAG: pH-response regulator protein palH/rim21 [Peltula sp. TS41687]|nr:MAG: pH-response regulator protein palH/rim21 [Peltula sp. TS41687]
MSTTIVSTSSRDGVSACTPFVLPSGGFLLADGISTITTLSKDLTFQPECTGIRTTGLAPSRSVDSLSDQDVKVPFYASTIPQTYAVAATTILSYTLVIVLLITPRALLSGAESRAGFAQARAIISEISGLSSVVGVGRRPWLQKFAALTVAVSLTMATSGTFEVVRRQYHAGYVDAHELRDDVVGSLKIRIIRVISDVFLWLAQAQTLIRLFPRHREKVIIKWTAFALIILFLVFSVLNNFVYPGTFHPRGYIHAIPALSYLFQLALSLLYAAWVMYYSFSKRRFAFFHRKMPNVCLVAALALISVLVPVIFFTLDVSKPDVAAWGDYVRWVGAAAASVVVWEWVERIEAIEREETRHGILGREIFDDDGMLDAPPPARIGWSGGRRRAWDDDGVVPVRQNAHGSIEPKTEYPVNPALYNTVRSQATSRRSDPSLQRRAGFHNSHTGNVLLRSMSGSPSMPTQDPRESTPQNSRAGTLSPATTCYAIHESAISAPPSRGPVEDSEVNIGDRDSNVAEASAHGPTDMLSEPTTRHDLANGPYGSGDPRSDHASIEIVQQAQPHIQAPAALQSLVQPRMSVLMERPEPRSSLDGLTRDLQKSWKLKLRSYATAKSAEVRRRFYSNAQQPILPVIVVPAPPRATKEPSPELDPTGQGNGGGDLASGDRVGPSSRIWPSEQG